MAEYEIQVNNLGKRYEQAGGSFAIENISFRVEKGQFITILGPSGCGKSVLMNLLCGIEKPSHGENVLEGKSFSHGVPASQRRRFGFAFQENNLLEWRTVEKNLMFPMECFHLKKSIDCKARVDEMLQLVGLENFQRSYPYELSGGMKQRIGFARTLMHDPGILLLDQPFGALDAITRKILNFDLLRIWKQTGKTIIMVTNSVEEAILLSSKAIFLSSGQPTNIQEVVDIDIPLNARNETITAFPAYQALQKKMDSLVHSLHIAAEEDTSHVEF